MKLAHLGDTHIKNLKYHYEYNIVFEKMYEILRQEKVDYIIHCGDIAHTKTQISPEFVEMCSKFLSNLADIAPTYVILGNHDGNLKNSSRQDAISPIVDALEHPNLHLLKNAGETDLGNGFALNVLSVFDEDNWVSPSNEENVNIALYHGSISGVTTDTGWVMTHGEHPIDIFEGHDYAFLGDIHKTNQRLDADGRIRYCGSTIQQNHGETNDKGFLIWDIQDKENFTCEHIELKNPKPFVTVVLTPAGKMPKNVKVPEGCRLRLVSENNLTVDRMRKATEVAKKRFNPETVVFLNRAAGTRGDVEDSTKNLLTEDLRSIEIQENLIKEYLEDYHIDKDTLEKVYSLNLKYNTLAEENEEIMRNVNWRLRSLEWDNLFNYGENNRIDFDSVEGIIGIFGKNYSGKSSTIDSLLYTVFNSTSKNDRKNLNIINQNRDYGAGRVMISVGERDYYIERKSEKYTKRLKGEETLEAKTNVEFNVYDPVTDDVKSLNGMTRNETDKNIKKVFGTLDDFMYSSMSTQMDSLAFIKEGSTKRKEILAKFLDLEFFEKKFKLAKEDAADTRAAIRRLENRDYDQEIEETQSKLDEINENLEAKKQACEKINERIANCTEEIAILKEKIDSIPSEAIDTIRLKDDLRDKKNQMISLSDENTELEDKRKKDKATYEKILDFESAFDLQSLQEKREKADELIAELQTAESELQDLKKELGRNNDKTKILSQIPCGSSYPTCKFIKDAYAAKAKIPSNEKEIDKITEETENLSDELKELDSNKINDDLNKYDQLINKKNNLSNQITKHDLKIEKNESIIKTLIQEIEQLETQLSHYELNKEVIENLEEYNQKMKNLKYTKASLETNLAECQSKIMDFYKEVGSFEQKVQTIKDQKEEFLNLQAEFSAYDLYMRCMHPNGIAYDVIKRKLPVINGEIAKILANICDFEVFFEDDGNRLNIFIKHPSYEPRPLEMGSGAEKTIAAMGIRLALLSVSSLPKSDIFILDEPGTALDEENMQGFIDILSLIKSYFKTVLLISHLDSLKDCVDMQITIEKKDGFAQVSV